ncbi:hypothetical protein LSTR_LSTR009264 [Laodelphax striatellus]|uniref:Uncharacterized protein n=1 Tax=Laodelphax striatellus TaxID=195883 RepID=A0A482WH97_LAOST|nr:hypothetical protein LSTR_LSTR009264 [Laodelphax striatellus]
MREVGFLVETLNGQQNPLMGNAFSGVSGGLSAGKELGYPTEVGNGQMQDFVGRHSFGGIFLNQAPDTQVAYKQLMDSVIEAAPNLQFKDVLNQSVLKEVEGRLISQRPRIQIKAPSSGLEIVGKPSQP